MAYNHEYPYTDPQRYNDDWLITNIGELVDNVDALLDWKATHEQEYEELKAFQEALIAGDFPEEMEKALIEWCVNNSASIFAELAKMVFFGITDDGYFVAYIPESWEDITFNTTGYDITIDLMPEYGHLVLSY